MNIVDGIQVHNNLRAGTGGGQFGWTPRSEHGALFGRDGGEPLGEGGHIQGLMRAERVVLGAPSIHRGLCGVQAVERTVRIKQFVLDGLMPALDFPHGCAASAGGRRPSRCISRAVLYQYTQAEVIFSRSARVAIGPPRNGGPSRRHSVLYSPIVVRPARCPVHPPTVPTEGIGPSTRVFLRAGPRCTNRHPNDEWCRRLAGGLAGRAARQLGESPKSRMRCAWTKSTASRGSARPARISVIDISPSARLDGARSMCA